MAKLNQARRDLIAKLRKQGKTYAQIGALLEPPVTRQAAYDMGRKLFPKVLGKAGKKAYK
jgi:hypothetical protein